MRYLVPCFFLLPSLACGESTPAEAAAPGSASVESATDAPSSAACGEKGQPDCPLQAWMKSNLQSQLRSQDFGRLETALARLATAQGLPFAAWSEMSRQGAAAAARGDLTGVRDACKGCHDDFRKAFRSEMRTYEPVWGE